MIKYFPKINTYLILFEFLHLKMLIFVVLSRWSRKLMMQNKRAIFIRAEPNIFHWDTSILNPEAHTWSVTSLMVAAHTMHADIYQVQLCNRMKRCRTIKTSASMAADVRHTYFFVSLCEIRYLPEIFDTTGWRHDLVDGTDLDDVSDFNKITCNHMLFKIKSGKNSRKSEKLKWRA